MKLLIVYFLCLALLFSCKPKNTQTKEPVVAVLADSMKTDTIRNDSVSHVVVVPKSADEYFSDFIYSFTSYESYQRSRIKFPLLCYKNGKKEYLNRKDWHFSKLHQRFPIYTVFFDKKSSLQLEKEKDVDNVKIEFFKFPERSVSTYSFEKIEGVWMLTQLENFGLSHYSDCDFVEFYQRFASDTIFQMEHLKDEISILLPDPNDEFSSVDGVLEAEQWLSFRPELPNGVFTNIDYGQSRLLKRHRVVAIEGSSNGFLCLLFFTKENGKWMLYRMEN